MDRIVFIGIAAVCLVLTALLWRANHAGQSPSDTDYLHGVDVAHYQGAIDWAELASDDTAFAFIKATEGVSLVDPRFEENWIGARRAGLLRGAYHYFSPCHPGADQAAFFLATVPDAAAVLPPVIDAEESSPCTEGTTISDIASEIAHFMDAVERGHGVRPIIYTNRSFYTEHLEKDLKDEMYWLSDFSGEPNFGPEDWLFWQYTDEGRRRGVAGPVDLNAFAGTEADLRALTGSN